MKQKSDVTVMLVDDDIDQLQLWQSVAKITGTVMSIRKGAGSALEWLQAVKYDVDAIIMDLSMPDMDGITLTKEIRTNEHIRQREHPIEIFWYTGWKYDEKNPHNPMTLAQKEYDVRRVWYKGDDNSDPLEVLHQVLDYVSGAPDKRESNNAS